MVDVDAISQPSEFYRMLYFCVSFLQSKHIGKLDNGNAYFYFEEFDC